MRIKYFSGYSIVLFFVISSWLSLTSACSQKSAEPTQARPSPANQDPQNSVGPVQTKSSLTNQHQLIYAFRKNKTTTIFSCNVKTLTCIEKFSDAATEMKLMGRGGSPDSVNVIRVSGNRMLAVGSHKTSEAGALYELKLDGSNQFRKIAAIESPSQVERIAVDPLGQRIAYPSISPDTEFQGEGAQFFVTQLVVHDVATGNIITRINTLKQINTMLIEYLGWGPIDGLLYIRINGDNRYTLFKIDQNNSFQRLPSQLDALKYLVGQFSNGDFLFVNSTLKTKELLVEDIQGNRKKQMPLINSGWHYELSSDNNYLGFQTNDNEIWIKDMRSGEEKRLLEKKNLDYWKESLSLIGWEVSIN
jgi:hypothetical protein